MPGPRERNRAAAQNTPGHPGCGGGIDSDLPAAPTPQWTVLEAGEVVGERHRTRDR
jgi:hypothetical protein